MAVRPDRQRQGIGSQLVRTGLEILKEQGCSYVIQNPKSDYFFSLICSIRCQMNPFAGLISRALLQASKALA
jgi:GNAT superfamily N-acetyltransferase